MSVTQLDFRKAMGCFATGVTVITVDQDGEVHGMTANAFTSVSMDPLLVLVCVDHRARTHAHLHAKKRFGVNVLAEDQRAISEYYARSSESHQHAEQAGARFERTKHGTPVLQGALAYLAAVKNVGFDIYAVLGPLHRLQLGLVKIFAVGQNIYHVVAGEIGVHQRL